MSYQLSETLLTDQLELLQVDEMVIVSFELAALALYIHRSTCESTCASTSCLVLQ